MSELPTTSNGEAGNGGSDGPSRELQAGWPRLRRRDTLPIALACVLLTAVTIPKLPPGVCFGDWGDLQLASVTLGIMHPPGYSGYVTLGFLATLVPGIDPAYAVSLLCMAAGILALMLCILIQVRLGVNAWIASAFVLSLAAHERVWSNLVAPEVYAPSLLFLVSAAYLLIKYARVGARRDLWWAAALFGVVLANRPTVVWMLPFFLAAWWHCSRAVARRRRPSRHRSAITPLGATLFAAVPGLYSLGYVWVRDTPNTPYNYLEQKRIESNSLPDTRNGFGAKLERLHWLVTAREFEGLIGNTGRGVRSRLRWLYREFFLYSVVDFVGMTFTIGFTTFVTVTVILVIGGVQVYFRCPASFWVLIGLAVGNVAFICTYRIYGHAADLLPLMFSATVLGGVAVSPLFPTGTSRHRQALAIGLMALACMVTLLHAPQLGRRTSVDAEPFLADLDMRTLPQHAVIVSRWHFSTALWYARHVLAKRHDIEIVNTFPHRWRERIEARPNRPVFVVMNIFEPGELALTPFRNVWRVERTEKARLPTAGSE